VSDDLGSVTARIERYFERALEEHGPTARGVDWNGSESQELRFEQFLRMIGDKRRFSLNDYGCGYGALLPWLRERGYEVTYRGYARSERMREVARELHGQLDRSEFVSSEDELEPADYSVASGVLNVKLDVEPNVWRDHALSTIQTLARLSGTAFAFNMLTKYSDADRMRPDLYYADPSFYFDYCKRTIARNVALLHDYGLYEFTMVVRFDSPI
jgi:SAM-dependent methyltransferase